MEPRIGFAETHTNFNGIVGWGFYYVVRETWTSAFGEEYLHYDGLWYDYCGEFGQWDARADAQAALDAAMAVEYPVVKVLVDIEL